MRGKIEHPALIQLLRVFRSTFYDAPHSQKNGWATSPGHDVAIIRFHVYGISTIQLLSVVIGQELLLQPVLSPTVFLRSTSINIEIIAGENATLRDQA